ncbi:MAG: hypothetical protein ACE5EJ_04585, partial [Nitrosopumilaceae archaeon]
LQTINVDDTYGIGETTTYSLSAPEHATQFINITGNSFNIDLKTPATGLQIPGADHKDNVDINWVHLEEGRSILKIRNTGDSDLHVMGTLQALTDPIQIIYHVIVIISGIVILGFSSAFSMRKPSGF